MNVFSMICIDSIEVKRMDKKAAVGGILGVFSLMVLILDTNTALQGAVDGISSCIGTVVPSLLPFILLSCWLNSTVTAQSLGIPPLIMKIAGLPKGTGTILISAVLGGYPAGAQAVHRAYTTGAIGKDHAERLLAYTNNAGPAFIFGLVGHMFPSVSVTWILWSVHLLSAFLVRLSMGPREYSSSEDVRFRKNGDDVILTSAKIMCTICIWVTAFRIIMSYLDVWFETRITPMLRPVLFGALELVNGCCSLPEISDLRVRFVACSAMLAFGGMCVTMQTASVTRGLDMRYYIAGKLLQTVFSATISAALAYRKWYLTAAVLAAVLIFGMRTKNKGGNPAPIRV